MRTSSLDGVHNICSCLSPHRMQHERRNREGSPQSLTSVWQLACASGQGSGTQELTAARAMHTSACHLKIPGMDQGGAPEVPPLWEELLTIEGSWGGRSSFLQGFGPWEAIQLQQPVPRSCTHRQQ